MFPAFYSPEPLSSLHKEGLSLAILFPVGILLAAFLAIYAIYWQKKQQKKAANTEISGDHIFFLLHLKLNQIIYTHSSSNVLNYFLLRHDWILWWIYTSVFTNSQQDQTPSTPDLLFKLWWFCPCKGCLTVGNVCTKAYGCGGKNSVNPVKYCITFETY